MSGGSYPAPGQDPWSADGNRPPWGTSAAGGQYQDPFSGNVAHPAPSPWGDPGPAGGSPGYPGGPHSPGFGPTSSAVLRNCSLRNGYVHDGLAALLLLTALFLPWNRFYSTVSNHLPLVTVAILLATLLSLASLGLPYLARLGVFGSGWRVSHTRLTRLLANLPYFAVVIGFLLYDVIRGYLRLAAGDGSISAGVGVAAWFGVAGAILAAQPRASELEPGRSPWIATGTYLLRVGLVLAVVSALTNAASVFTADSDVAIKLLAVVLPAVVTSAAVVAVAVLGIGRDFVSGRLVVSAVAVAALVAGLCLSFGFDTGDSSSGATATDTSAQRTSPQPVYAERLPVLVVLDTSSSMDEFAISGSTRIEAARESVDQLIDSLDANRQFALMSFPGNGPVVDGCSTGELKIPFGTVNPSTAHATVSRLVPDGETPTGPALNTAGDLIKRFVGGKGVIVLISDGDYTCGSNPCDVARQLADDGLQIQVNTVGFQISSSGADELECIARTTGGQYVPVQNPEQLQAAIADLSSSGPASGRPWLEYFHYDFGGPERLGYLAVLLWVAAAAAMVNPGAHPSGAQDDAGSGYRWLFAGSRLMLLVALWNVGSVAVESISALLKFSSAPAGGLVAHIVLSAAAAVSAVVCVRALQPRHAPGVDPRPPRTLALATSAGVAGLALVAAVVRAVAFDGVSVGLLDLTGIWVPAMVAAALVGARPIRSLYADRPLFAGRTGKPGHWPAAPYTGGASPSGYPAPGYAPSGYAPPGQSASGRPPSGFPPPDVADPFSLTYFEPGGVNAPNPFSGNAFSSPSSVDPTLSPAELHRLAQTRPDLRLDIARHPNADPGLLSWLGQLGDPAVAQAVSQRMRRR